MKKKVFEAALVLFSMTTAFRLMRRDGRRIRRAGDGRGTMKHLSPTAGNGWTAIRIRLRNAIILTSMDI